MNEEQSQRLEAVWKRHTSSERRDARILGLLEELVRKVDLIGQKVNAEMATLDDILNDVTAEPTLIASLSTLLTGIQSQLAAALAGTTLPTAVQAKVDAVFAAAEANKTALTAAVAANVPNITGVSAPGVVPTPISPPATT